MADANDSSDADTHAQSATPAGAPDHEHAAGHDHDDGDEFDVDWGLEDTQQPEGKQQIYLPNDRPAVVRFIDWDDINEYKQRHQAADRSGQSRADAAAGADEVALDNDLVAEIIRDRYVKPDFSGLTGAKVGGMKPQYPDMLLGALMNTDDVDVNVHGDGSATISTGEDEGK